MHAVPRLLALVLATAALAGCAGSARPDYKAASPQEVETDGAVGQLISGNYNGVNYLAKTAIRVYPADGKLGICGLYRVLATEDISRQARGSLNEKASFLTIRSADGNVTVGAEFMAFVFKEAPLDVAKFDRDKTPGNCIVTDYPWKDSFTSFKPELRLVKWVYR